MTKIGLLFALVFLSLGIAPLHAGERPIVGELPNGYRFAIVNFATPDMVGHTGVIPAVVRAVEAVDACLGRVLEAVERLRGVAGVTADHGNAEQQLEPDGSPH
ncbi:hypothetical protein B4Q13_21010, partial [Lacticaseibacillus rhamnosus]